jgi:uncharacterized protein
VLPNERDRRPTVQLRFIALIKPPFKSSDDYRHSRLGKKAGEDAAPEGDEAQTGEYTMARFEMLDADSAPLGEGPAASDMLFELGMMYSVGRDAPVDLVNAHKWFNLAAVRGNADAIRLRREIAELMSEIEIAAAQGAARDWLSAH